MRSASSAEPALNSSQTRRCLPWDGAVLHLPQLQAAVGRHRRLRGLLDAGGAVPRVRLRLSLRAARGLLPGAGDGIRRLRRGVTRARRRPRRVRADRLPRRRPDGPRGRRGSRALGSVADRGRARMGRAQAGPGASDPDERRARQATSPSTSSRRTTTTAACWSRSLRASAARLDPDLRGEREQLAVLGEERGAREELAAVLAERPGRRRRSARRSPGRGRCGPSSGREPRSPRPSPPDRVRAGAVDRGPDDLGRRLGRPHGAACSGSRPATGPTWISSPSCSPRDPHTKHSRTRARRCDVPCRGLVGLGEGDGRGRLEVELADAASATTASPSSRTAASPFARTASGRSSGGGGEA